jgi:diphosphomevalonate decarboxylase
MSQRGDEQGGHLITLNQQTRADHKINKLLDQALIFAARHGHPWAHPDHTCAVMTSVNSVPTASGLASSASGMAALGVAAWSALGYGEDLEHIQSGLINDRVSDLISLVRIGSGSAVRSLLGGLVRLERDGSSLRALCSHNEWDLALVVGVVDPGPKAVSSREGMERTRRTSPYHQAWIDTHAADLDAAEEAVKHRDLEQLGELMEHSTFKMHASMWASRPPLRYLKGVSLDLLDQVERLRAQGVGAWATMDAGPHVKVLCARADADKVASTLSEVPGLSDVVTRYPGRAAHVMK